MAAPAKRPKQMSSALAGMKFMQRGLASNSSSAPSTPSEPSSKRQRLSSGFAATPPSASREENRAREVLDREAAERGDTKWYLSVQKTSTPAVESPLRIVSAGYGALDAPYKDDSESDNEEVDGVIQLDGPVRPSMPGRKSFGKFNRKIEKQQNPDLSLSSSSDSDSADEDEDEEEDVGDDPTGVKALIAQGRKDASKQLRAQRKVQKKEEEAESKRLAEQRRKKAVNLNTITSISGGGGSGGGSKSYFADMVCHNCNQKGHKGADCPKKGSNNKRKSY